MTTKWCTLVFLDCWLGGRREHPRPPPHPRVSWLKIHLRSRLSSPSRLSQVYPQRTQSRTFSQIHILLIESAFKQSALERVRPITSLPLIEFQHLTLNESAGTFQLYLSWHTSPNHCRHDHNDDDSYSCSAPRDMGHGCNRGGPGRPSQHASY